MPPLVGGFSDGKVTWQRLDRIDYDMLGYLLSCHLIIEHYLDHFLRTYTRAPFGWEGAKLTFGQKTALVTSLPLADRYDFVPSVKHLNSLRNRFGHNINAQLTDEDFLPFRLFLEKCTSDTKEIPSDRRELLAMYMGIVCAYMASSISHAAQFIHGPNS